MVQAKQPFIMRPIQSPHQGTLPPLHGSQPQGKGTAQPPFKIRFKNTSDSQIGPASSRSGSNMQ